jgi:hypothetical protein
MPVPAADDRLRGRANDRARAVLDGILNTYPAGYVVLVDYLTSILNQMDMRRNYSNARTGRLLSERSDVKQVRPGVWQVIR